MQQDTGPNRALDTAVAHHEAGHLDLAEAAYRAILEAEPNDADALNLLGLILQGRGEYPEAIERISRALEIDPDFPEALTNLARAKRASGDANAAAELATRATALEPDLAEAHFQLGRALLDLTREQDALTSLQRATELNPTLIDAQLGLGNLRMRRHDFAGAATALKAVLAAEPDRLEALINLGACLRTLGQTELALTYQRRAASLAPEDPVPHAAIGVTLRQAGNIQGSIEACVRALALTPNHHDMLVLLGTNYVSLGRFDDAEATFRKALTFSPESGSARAGLAGIHRGSAEASEIERLSACMNEATASEFERGSAGFALGSVLDRAGRYDEAFQAFAAANTIVLEARHAAGQTFDLPMVRRHSAWVKQIFDADLFAATAEWGDPSDRPVFVVGMPRSGTTLVEQIAASHPLVCGAGELRAIPQVIGDLDGGAAHISPLRWDRSRVRTLSSEHVAALAGRDPNAVRTIDKLPDNIQLLGQIAVLFPNARVVVCRRDLRDVCLSCYFQHFGSGNEWSFDLATCAARAREIEELLAHWLNVLPLRVMQVGYETLVADLEGESRRLVAFLGLEWNQACLDFHRAGRPVLTASHWQVRQPLYATSIGRWRHYQTHLGPMAGLRGLVPDEASVPAPPDPADECVTRVCAHLHAHALQEAQEAARHAIALAPDRATGYGLLGLCLLEDGQSKEALAPLQEAIRIAPAWLNPRIDLASALTRLKDFAAAVAAWRQALALQPDNVSCLSALASVLRELGQHREALEPLKRTTALQPGNARFHFALAMAWLGVQDVSAAEAPLRQALQLEPDEPEYLFSLGEVLCILGHFPEAAKYLKQAAQHRSYAAQAYEGLAAIGETFTAGSDLPRLRDMLEDAGEDSSIRAAAGFALATALDRVGAYDEAFRSCALANRLTRNRHRELGRVFDLPHLRRFVDGGIAGLTAPILAAGGAHGDPSEVPVFIVGMPRSGTTLVEQIAASHPAVVGLGETKAISLLTEELDAEAVRLGRNRWLGSHVRAKSAAHVAALRAAGGDALRVIDKMPDSLQLLGQIAMLFPRARVILCRRDLRDVGLSCFMEHFTEGMEWSFDLADIGARAYQMERLAQHWRHVLPLPILEVQYETLVGDLEGQSRRLIDFLGLDWDPACLSFHTTKRPITTASHWQVRQPLYSSSIGRWRHYRRHLGPLIGSLKDLVPRKPLMAPAPTSGRDASGRYEGGRHAAG